MSREVKCLQCEETFKGEEWKKRKFCSKPCQFLYRRGSNHPRWKSAPIERVCPICKIIFKARLAEVASGGGVYCSLKCVGIQNGGHQCHFYKHGQSRTKEYRRIYVALRTARLRKAKGIFTSEDVIALYHHQAGKCAVCKEELKNKYHVDHIMPLARGGSNWPENLQLLCPSCNLKKGAKHPLEFMVSKGILTP